MSNVKSAAVTGSSEHKDSSETPTKAPDKKGKASNVSVSVCPAAVDAVQNMKVYMW